VHQQVVGGYERHDEDRK